MQLKHFFYTASLVLALSTPALAQSAASTAINQLPEEGNVQISGTVSAVDGANEFTLQDATGKVDVSTSAPANVKEGDQVNVNGEVNTGFFGGKEIENATVNTAAGNAMEQQSSAPAPEAAPAEAASSPEAAAPAAPEAAAAPAGDAASPAAAGSSFSNEGAASSPAEDNKSQSNDQEGNAKQPSSDNSQSQQDENQSKGADASRG